MGKNSKGKEVEEGILDLDFEGVSVTTIIWSLMQERLREVKWDDTWGTNRLKEVFVPEGSPKKQNKKKGLINTDSMNNRENDDYEPNDDYRDAVKYMTPDVEESPTKSVQLMQKQPDEPAPFFEGWDQDAFNAPSNVDQQVEEKDQISQPSVYVAETFKEFGLDSISNEKKEEKLEEDTENWLDKKEKEKDTESPAAQLL